MKLIPVLSCLCLAAASLPAQTFLLLPATAGPASELPNNEGFSPAFTAENARVQMLFSETEVGAATLVADQLSLRYDGPIPAAGAPGPFSIQRLQIRIGSTSVPLPGADFAANLSQPLQTVFDHPWTFLPDQGAGSPHGWGDPAGSLQFTFDFPMTVVIPPGGWLVIELSIEGNNLPAFGFAHAILDGATTSGGVQNGTSVTFGQGCPAGTGLPAATMTTTGVYGPGAAHWLNGQNLGANAFVIAAFGIDNTMSGGTPLPLTFPGTNCTLYLDPIVLGLVIADANGAVLGKQPGAALVLPPDNTAFAGLAVYEQLVSLVATANPTGLVFSNAATVTLGSFATLGRGTYSVSNVSDANATIATSVRPFGYAVQLRTL